MGIRVFLNDAQFKAASDALKAAGHELVVDTTNNVHTFIAKLESDFPKVYAAIKTGIATVKAPGQSGGDKAVSVAMQALAIAPTVLKDLSGVKDALTAATTVLFASEISDFKNVAVETIGKL